MSDVFIILHRLLLHGREQQRRLFLCIYMYTCIYHLLVYFHFKSRKNLINIQVLLACLQSTCGFKIIPSQSK